MINHKHFLGYTKDKDGNLIFEPEETKAAKWIFYSYFQIITVKQIFELPQMHGITTGSKKYHLLSIGTESKLNFTISTSQAILWTKTN